LPGKLARARLPVVIAHFWTGLVCCPPHFAYILIPMRLLGKIIKGSPERSCHHCRFQLGTHHWSVDHPGPTTGPLAPLSRQYLVEQGTPLPPSNVYWPHPLEVQPVPIYTVWLQLGNDREGVQAPHYTGLPPRSRVVCQQWRISTWGGKHPPYTVFLLPNPDDYTWDVANSRRDYCV
jgi:hypothetical protein